MEWKSRSTEDTVIDGFDTATFEKLAAKIYWHARLSTEEIKWITGGIIAKPAVASKKKKDLKTILSLTRNAVILTCEVAKPSPHPTLMNQDR